MTAFDRWLEKPYTDQAALEEEYEKFCETNDLDFDDESSRQAFQEWLDSQEEIGPDPDDERDRIWEDEQDGRYSRNDYDD
jgi:hypothetical protein